MKVSAILVLALLTVSVRVVARPTLAPALRALASNPLLRGLPFPRYAEINHEHVTAAMQQLVQLVEEKIAVLENDDAPDFASLSAVMEEINIYISRIWAPVAHLYTVSSTAELRVAYEEALPQLTQLKQRLQQSPQIYRKLLALAQDTHLDTSQQRIVTSLLNEARAGGMSLRGEKQKRFNIIRKELAQLEMQFRNNSLDAIKDFQLILRVAEDCAGLNQDILQRASERYRQVTGDESNAAEGPWLITLDYASYVSFMSYSTRRDLRELLYRERSRLASTAPYDNAPLIKRILQLRREKAQLLGFANHAELVLSQKMAGEPARVRQFLDELHAAGYARSLAEFEQLSAYAAANGGPTKLEPWDVMMWERLLREEHLRIDMEELRKYFPLPHVLEKMFALFGKLFGIGIEENPSAVQVWHPDVKFFQVHDADGTHIASLYLDLFSRPQSKSAGAWKITCNDRNLHQGALELPLCSIVANFAPPVADTPALLSFGEMKTLFHEFGHALHVMLTTVEYGSLAGTNGVERDAVEMPSNLMENFLYIDSIIQSLSRHIDSGEPLPSQLLVNLSAAKNFLAARNFQHQLFLSYLDLQLHTDFDAETQDPFTLMREIAAKTLPMPDAIGDNHLNNFLHLFAVGYDVNYYGYAWGEMMAADAFELFKANGFDDEGLRRSGQRYRDTVLAAGGSKHPLDIFRELRGRAPSVQAFLKNHGLTE